MNKTTYIGVTHVTRDPTNVHYRAQIHINGKQTCISGRFTTARDAAIAYDNVAIRYNKQTNILKQITK